MSQVNSQTKQFKMLHMAIKHVHKSLANISEKNVLLYQFFFNLNSRKKQNKLFSVSTLFVELTSISVNASMYFNYDFIFFVKAQDKIVNW